MRKIKSLANKLKEKYYRTKETVCDPANVFPGDVFHSERFDVIQWKGSGNYDLNTYSFRDGTYYDILQSWTVRKVDGDLIDDEKYGRYDGLESRKWYIKDESSPDVYKYGYTSIPISSYKHDIVIFKTVYDTIEKYATLIDNTQLTRIKELSDNLITQEYVPARYFGFEGSEPTYKSESNPVAFNNTDGDEQIDFMKRWVYAVKRTGIQVSPKYELYGWGSNMGNTTDININDKFNAVLGYLDLVPSFLPKNIYTFTSDRYNIPASETNPFAVSSVLNTLLSTTDEGVLHIGSGFNILNILYNPISEFIHGGVPQFHEQTQQIQGQTQYMGGSSHSILQKFLLKNGTVDDSYYILNKDLVGEYPNAVQVLAKLMSLTEDELSPIINDRFRRISIDTSASSPFRSADEEKLKLTDLVTNNKLRKYHVLDLILRNVDGFRIPELEYITNQFVSEHPGNRAIFVGNNHYCYLPVDADTYSMSTEDYIATIVPITIGAHSDESVITNNAKTLPFTREQFMKYITFSDDMFYSEWSQLQSSDYEFVSSAREVLEKKQGQRITKQFDVYTVKGSTELLIINRIMNPMEFPQLYNYDTFKKFYDHLGYTINKPVAPTEDQMTEYVNSLNMDPNARFPWSKIEEMDTAGLNAKKIYQHIPKRDIFSPDNYSEFVGAYDTEHDHEHNVVNIVLSKDHIANLMLIEDSEDSNMVIRVNSKPSYYYKAGTEKDQYNSAIEFILNNATAREWLYTTDAEDLVKSRLDESSRYSWLVEILQPYADGTLLTTLNNWLSHIDKAVTINADKLQKVVETNVSGVSIEVVHVSSLLTYGSSGYRDSTLRRIIENNNTYLAENSICQIEGHEGWLFILYYSSDDYIGSGGTPNIIYNGYESPDNRTLIKFLKELS